MPNIESARKSLRSDVRKRMFNDRRRKVMRQTIKSFRTLLKEKKSTEAQAMIPNLYQAIDKAVKGGVIKFNSGSRKKSRLNQELKKIAIKA